MWNIMRKADSDFGFVSSRDALLALDIERWRISLTHVRHNSAKSRLGLNPRTLWHLQRSQGDGKQWTYQISTRGWPSAPCCSVACWKRVGVAVEVAAAWRSPYPLTLSLLVHSLSLSLSLCSCLLPSFIAHLSPITVNVVPAGRRDQERTGIAQSTTRISQYAYIRVEIVERNVSLALRV